MTEASDVKAELQSLEKILSDLEKLLSGPALEAARAPLLEKRQEILAQLNDSVATSQNHRPTVGTRGFHGRDVNHGIIITGDNNSVRYIIQNYKPEPEVENDELRRVIGNYLNWIREQHGTVVLSGIKREGEAVIQLDLEDVYVPLQAKVMERSAGKKRGKEDEKQTGTIQLDQLIDIGRRLIIIGGPGCGKTTVLSHLAYILSTAIALDDPNYAREELGLKSPLPLPIYIPLNRFASHLRTLPPGSEAIKKTLSWFISSYMIERTCDLDLPDNFFRDLLRAEHAVLLLLDGLDEVPDENTRALVREKVEDLVAAQPQMRVIVTCRTAAYKDRSALSKGFQQVSVLPLTEDHIRTLIEKAYTNIFATDPFTAQDRVEDLLRGIEKLETERKRRFGENEQPLVTSPLMIRMLLILHYSDRHLPEQRAELFMRTTDVLLLPDFGRDEEVAEQIGEMVGGSRERHRDMLEHLAFMMHSKGETLGREIEEGDLRKILISIPEFAPFIDTLINLTRTRGSILEENLGMYRFIHLGFQEYLTGRYLAEVIRSQSGIDGILQFLRTGPLLESWWRESILLTIGYLSITSARGAEALVRGLAGLAEEMASASWNHDLRLAGMELAGSALLDWPSSSIDLRHEVAHKISSLFLDHEWMSHPPSILRARAGETLGRLGDPRFREDFWYLPNEPLLGFVRIPEGPFWMGSDPTIDKDEYPYPNGMPYHSLNLAEFYIARYPVTGAQYKVFVQSCGYVTSIRFAMEGIPNHPVVHVTWYDALAYCKWLEEKLRTGDSVPEELAVRMNAGWKVSLPSEVEWEKGSRGDDRRLYPWGNTFDAEKVNMDETKIGKTSAVGCFPAGASLYGAQDLSGNVWEWTCSLHSNYPSTNQIKEREDPQAGRFKLNVLRGGSFLQSRGHVQCNSRGWRFPDVGFPDIGFRVILSPCDSGLF